MRHHHHGRLAVPGAAIWLVLLELRTPLITLISSYSIGFVGLILIPGETPDGEPFHLSFLQAFYILSYTATTIGYGEIPYPFTAHQRLWVLVVMYSTVIAWLYALGAVLTVLTDPEFRKVRTYQKTCAAIRANRSAFWLVCGYGGAGGQLVRFLDTIGVRCVVVDLEKSRFDDARLSMLSYELDVLWGDAMDPRVLVDAGVQHPRCQGVLVLTDLDEVNLTVATNVKILAPRVSVFARSASDANTRNLRSFGTEVIVDVERSMARGLGQLIRRPKAYALYHELVDPDLNRVEPIDVPQSGHWILCASGRMAQLVAEVLERENIAYVLVSEQRPMGPSASTSPTWIEGVGTEAVTLRQAGINQATGVIAATAHDGDNLSILLTARAECPRLITIAKRNRPASDPVFQHAQFTEVLRPGRLMAGELFARIQSPLLHQFLSQLDLMPEALVDGLIERLARRLSDPTVELDHSVVLINEDQAPACMALMGEGIPLELGYLMTDPGYDHQRLPVICLLLVRFNGDLVPFPGSHLPLQYGDQILFWGEQGVQGRIDWLLGRLDLLRGNLDLLME